MKSVAFFVASEPDQEYYTRSVPLYHLFNGARHRRLHAHERSTALCRSAREVPSTALRCRVGALVVAIRIRADATSPV